MIRSTNFAIDSVSTAINERDEIGSAAMNFWLADDFLAKMG